MGAGNIAHAVDYTFLRQTETSVELFSWTTVNNVLQGNYQAVSYINSQSVAPYLSTTNVAFYGQQSSQNLIINFTSRFNKAPVQGSIKNNTLTLKFPVASGGFDTAQYIKGTEKQYNALLSKLKTKQQSALKIWQKKNADEMAKREKIELVQQIESRINYYIENMKNVAVQIKTSQDSINKMKKDYQQQLDNIRDANLRIKKQLQSSPTCNTLIGLQDEFDTIDNSFYQMQYYNEQINNKIEPDYAFSQDPDSIIKELTKATLDYKNALTKAGNLVKPTIKMDVVQKSIENLKLNLKNWYDTTSKIEEQDFFNAERDIKGMIPSVGGLIDEYEIPNCEDNTYQ